jgi:dCTP deaminase
MGVKNDEWIRQQCGWADGHPVPGKPMIDPFESGQVKAVSMYAEDDDGNTRELDFRRKVISYGTSSYGYDIRCADEFKIFTDTNTSIIDPKNFDERAFVDFKGDVCIIPPNSFALTRTIEYFRIPRDVLTICLGKSTYARCGIIINVTPFEPEWEGYATLEISNTTRLPAKIYANEGIAQVIFLGADWELAEPTLAKTQFEDPVMRRQLCKTSYADRPGGPGKYQAQQGIVPAKV